MTALVSIITRTTGARPRLLARALASVAAQSWPTVESIVVEDGPGRSAALVARVAEARPGAFRHTPTGRPIGRSRAGNLGLETARGDYVGFLDDDDELHADHVERLVGALAGGGARLAYARADILEVDNPQADEEGGVRVAAAPFEPFSRLRLFLANAFPIQAALFARALFVEKGGFDPTLDALEDWDLWLRYGADEDFVAIDAVTSLYRMPAHRADLEARAARHAAHYAKLMDKHRDLAGDCRFAEVAGLPAKLRAELPFRHAVSIAATAAVRRIGDLARRPKGRRS